MPSPREDPPNRSRPSTPQQIWRRFCRFMGKVFYRRFEVSGVENVPAEGPLILCGNHVNALVDAVVIQGASPRPIHPIARSGLFRNPVLRPILAFIQAVPIYRRPKDPEAQAAGDNEASFRRCFEYLGEGRVILIFPEGQSHSDPSLRPLKTGAARLALGHRERTGESATVLPVGLTFTAKGRFRGSVLVQFGEPVPFEPVEDEEKEEAVRRYTDAIDRGLKRVTLNVDSWEDLALLRSMQQFFALRRRRDQRTTLARRFRSFQRLIDAHRALRSAWPDRVEGLRLRLQKFHQLCSRYGVRDYQLGLRYTPGVVARFVVRTLLFVLLVVPPALCGLLGSALPYLATRAASRRFARGRDQYDTAGMMFGLLFFGLFWGAQTAFVAWRWGAWPAAALYGLSLPLTAAVALKVGYERHRIREEIRVFLLFMRRRELQGYLRERRADLEAELARMARLAKEAKGRMAAGMARTQVQGRGGQGEAAPGQSWSRRRR